MQLIPQMRSSAFRLSIPGMSPFGLSWRHQTSAPARRGSQPTLFFSPRLSMISRRISGAIFRISSPCRLTIRFSIWGLSLFALSWRHQASAPARRSSQPTPCLCYSHAKREISGASFPVSFVVRPMSQISSPAFNFPIPGTPLFALSRARQTTAWPRYGSQLDLFLLVLLQFF